MGSFVTQGTFDTIDMQLTGLPSVVNLYGSNPNANGDGIDSYKGDTTPLDDFIVSSSYKKKTTPTPIPATWYWWLFLGLVPIFHKLIVKKSPNSKNRR